MRWLDKHLICKEEHKDDLERDAATNQYVNGMTKDHAELSAYDKYKRIQHAKAAAYHLDGMEDANHVVKNPHMADQHYAMYCMHANVLGGNPRLAVLPEIVAFRNMDREPAHAFRPHEADVFVLGKK